LFEIERLLPDDGESIILQTRKRSSIQNRVEPPSGAQQIARYERLRAKFGRYWVQRKSACGVYNCFGMVFASRRTSVFEEAEIAKILSDDNYREVLEAEVSPGDLVLYRDVTHGLIHVAMVTRREKRDGMSDAIFTLSKWDSTCGEDEHMMYFHPWVSGFNLSVQFLREG